MKSRPIILRQSLVKERDFKEGQLYECAKTIQKSAEMWIGTLAWREKGRTYVPKIGNIMSSPNYFGVEYLFRPYTKSIKISGKNIHTDDIIVREFN